MVERKDSSDINLDEYAFMYTRDGVDVYRKKDHIICINRDGKMVAQLKNSLDYEGEEIITKNKF